MKAAYQAAQQKYVVRINTGLMTAIYVRAAMLVEQTDPNLISYGKTSFERIKASGWELKKKSK